MKRKTIQLGGQTLLVSLPKQFVKKYNIKKGEELDVEEVNNIITIATPNQISFKDINIGLSSLASIKDIILLLSTIGLTKIRLNYKSREYLNEIKKEIYINHQEFEIISETEISCVIKLTTSDEIIKEFPNLLKRLFYILMSDEENEIRDIEKNKLIRLCKRILNKHQVENYNQSLLLYSIIDDLEKMQSKEEINVIYQIFYQSYSQSINQTALSDIGQSLRQKVLAYKLMKEGNVFKL